VQRNRYTQPIQYSRIFLSRSIPHTKIHIFWLVNPKQIESFERREHGSERERNRDLGQLFYSDYVYTTVVAPDTADLSIRNIHVRLYTYTPLCVFVRTMILPGGIV
jgi:hypothetical protein